MRLLLDSHVLLWYDTATQLQGDLRGEIDSADSIRVSVVTVCELTLKMSLGRLALRAPVIQIAEGNVVSLLAITP